MMSCICSFEPGVTSWVTFSPSLAKKPFSFATQLGTLVPPPKLIIFTSVCAQAGAAKPAARPAASRITFPRNIFPPQRFFPLRLDRPVNRDLVGLVALDHALGAVAPVIPQRVLAVHLRIERTLLMPRTRIPVAQALVLHLVHF